MANEMTNMNTSGNVFHIRSHRFQRNNSTVCRKLRICAARLLFFGMFLLFAGIIMTCVSYIRPAPLDNPFFKDKDPFRIVGPIILTLGILFIISSIILGCVTRNDMKRNSANNFQLNFAPSAPPLPPQYNLSDIHHNLNISGYNPYHQSEITILEQPPPYESLK